MNKRNAKSEYRGFNQVHQIARDNALTVLELIKFLGNYKPNKIYNRLTQLTPYEIELIKSSTKKGKVEERIKTKRQYEKGIDNYMLDKYIEINDNNKDKTFQSLIGNYFLYSKRVTIIDPYIREEHQIRNFIEISHTILRSSNSTLFKEINLITSYSELKQKSQNIKLFSQFKKIARKKFMYDFNYVFEKNIHDRIINIDDKYRIFLGRGLDLFKQVDKSSHKKYSSLETKGTYIIILKKVK